MTTAMAGRGGLEDEDDDAPFRFPVLHYRSA